MDAPDKTASRTDCLPDRASSGSEEQLARLIRKFSRRDRRQNLLILAAAAILVFAVWMVWNLRLVDLDWKSLGYTGVFLLSFLGSVSMVLPVPGLISLCGASAVLNPLTAAILAGVGEAVGELSGYAVGYGGKTVVEDHGLYRRVRVWMGRRGALMIFIVCLIPNPLVDVVGIAAGATRFPLARFLAIALVGKILKSLMVAYACHAGIQLLPWLD